MTTNFSLSQFVADLRSITGTTADEREVLRQVAPLAERLAANPALKSEPAVHSNIEKGFSFNLLHEEPDHSLAIALLSWLPSGATLPHNHGTWGIVVGLEGAEKNIFWQRLDDGSRAGYAELQRIGDGVRTWPSGGTAESDHSQRRKHGRTSKRVAACLRQECLLHRPVAVRYRQQTRVILGQKCFVSWGRN